MKNKLLIIINGTSENPWRTLGFKQNPFPQLAAAQWMIGETALNSLAGEPVKDADDIRTRLTGKVSDELIDLCIEQFEPGKEVRFLVEFDT
jgi:hypothetical protein